MTVNAIEIDVLLSRGRGMLPPHVWLVPAPVKMLMSTSIIFTYLKLSQSQLQGHCW